jgi:hypothetical protein
MSMGDGGFALELPLIVGFAFLVLVFLLFILRWIFSRVGLKFEC